ncbi:MAG TPA: ferredoxin [Natronoarchaeum rubrum]|nr:ferredoxin [Natronoarchaeum rubrum]
MTTEYRIELDRDVCEGIFACLVRDERFVEADDGLASIEGADAEAEGDAADRPLVAAFDDDRIDAARQAADACPVDAIEVTKR